MKAIGIVLFLFGLFLILGGAAVGITLAVAGPPIRCDSVDIYKKRAEDASRELASATATERQRELQKKNDDANAAYRGAVKNCEEAWTDRYIQMGIAGGAAFIGAVLFLGGLALFFVGRWRSKRSVA